MGVKQHRDMNFTFFPIPHANFGAQSYASSPTPKCGCPVDGGCVNHSTNVSNFAGHENKTIVQCKQTSIDRSLRACVRACVIVIVGRGCGR